MDFVILFDDNSDLALVKAGDKAVFHMDDIKRVSLERVGASFTLKVTNKAGDEKVFRPNGVVTAYKAGTPPYVKAGDLLQRLGVDVSSPAAMAQPLSTEADNEAPALNEKQLAQAASDVAHFLGTDEGEGAEEAGRTRVEGLSDAIAQYLASVE